MFEKMKTRHKLKKLERKLHINIRNMFYVLNESISDSMDNVNTFIDRCNSGFRQDVKFKVLDQDTLSIIYDDGLDLRIHCTDPGVMCLNDSIFVDKNGIYDVQHYARLNPIFTEICSEALWISLCKSTKIK